MKKKYYNYFEIIIKYSFFSNNKSISNDFFETLPKYLTSFYYKDATIKDYKSNQSNKILYIIPLSKGYKYIYSNVSKNEIHNEVPNDFIKIDIKRQTTIDNPENKDLSNIIKIMEVYKIPYHLNKIYIIDQTLDEANKNLVYFGADSTNKIQYFYGTDFIKNRNEERKDIFINVYHQMPKIHKYISTHFPKSKKITNDNLMSVLLLLELKTFIRTGKNKYLNENNTQGILSLKNESISIEKDAVLINFYGKKDVEQYFKIEDSRIRDGINFIYNKKHEFLFTNHEGKRLSETYFYHIMKKLKITLKNIRTYGVNILLLNEIYTYLTNDEINNENRENKIKSDQDLRKLINVFIKKNAEIIGHTSSVSKKSYISDDIINKILDNKSKISKLQTFDEFLKLIVS